MGRVLECMEKSQSQHHRVSVHNICVLTDTSEMRNPLLLCNAKVATNAYCTV